MREEERGVELKQLRAFVAVAENLHFGLAAEHLRLAQPQVSRRIAQLEDDLDVILFERNSRTVKLTDVGKAFLPEATSLIRSADAARQRAIERARGRHGLLKVGLIDAAMIGTVTPILRTFHRRYPEVYLSFRNPGVTSGVQLETLGDGSADVVFTHPPDRVDDVFDQILLVNDPLVAVLPERHRLAELGTLDLSELSNEPWVMFPRENNPPIHDRIISLCHGSGFSPKIVHETGHMLTRLGLVAGGFGVHLVHAAWRAMPYPGVVYIPIEPTANVTLSCFWRCDNRSPLLKNLIDIVRGYQV